VIRNGERSNGGMMPLRPQMGDIPANWMPYFGHADVEALAGELPGLGGAVYNGPMDIGMGKIAVLADPQGAAFAVWTGQYDD
jgi:predicted enzyme related to lactoylglutathione lyase